ncbi:hypothetical protein GCM10009665_21120 [Kitasatospora nipponensis]|uniref:Uncharacterized protein n=1 Tax=Kitasatospora nipponensis TaxID=258049 RepID=A0ABP4GMZ5_9ACTN
MTSDGPAPAGASVAGAVGTADDAATALAAAAGPAAAPARKQPQKTSTVDVATADKVSLRMTT